MALFCVAIRRNSLSLLRFLFLSYVHFFSCEMSIISHLKRPQRCFSSHFCFLVIVVLLVLVLSVSFLVVVISPSTALFYVVFKSLYRSVNVAFNVGKFSSTFFS